MVSYYMVQYPTIRITQSALHLTPWKTSSI